MAAEILAPIAIFDNQTYIKEQACAAKPHCKTIANANQDFEHAKQFLMSYVNRQDTYNVYRKELERFLQWA